MLAGLLVVCAVLGDFFRFWVIVEISIAWAFILIVLRILKRPLPAAPVSAVFVATMAFLAIAIVTMWTRGALAVSDFHVATVEAPAAETGLPNMYVLLLDGYPRQDTVLGEYHLDLQPFIQELEELGFAVYPDAEADFYRTELTLASMLADRESPNIADLDYGEFFYELRNTRRDVRRELLADGPILDELAAAGYSTVYIPPPVGHVVLGGWNRTVDTGQLSEFEVVLIQKSALAPMLGSVVMDQQADRVRESLSQWVEEASGDEQKVVFAHLDSPHPPFVFGADGTVNRRPPDCWYLRECNLFNVHRGKLEIPAEEYDRRLREQIIHLNRLVIDAVASVVALDPSAVVVVLSDHGARAEDEPTEEWHRTLLAARIPHNPSLLAESPGPDRLFERMLSSVAHSTQPSSR
jgi:hypothetical protein